MKRNKNNAPDRSSADPSLIHFERSESVRIKDGRVKEAFRVAGLYRFDIMPKNRYDITNSAHIVVRKATNRDCQVIRAHVQALLSEFSLPFYPEGKDADLKDIERSNLRAEGMFEVIEDAGGALLGAYGLFPLNDSSCELRKMYFVPEIKGIGLGKRSWSDP